jgi:hypothetical protein
MGGVLLVVLPLPQLHLCSDDSLDFGGVLYGLCAENPHQVANLDLQTDTADGRSVMGAALQREEAGGGSGPLLWQAILLWELEPPPHPGESSPASPLQQLDAVACGAAGVGGVEASGQRAAGPDEQKAFFCTCESSSAPSL